MKPIPGEEESAMHNAVTILILTTLGVGALFLVAGWLVEASGDPGGMIMAIGAVLLLIAVFILATIGGVSLWAA
jgi:uncharacterized membrane protein (UPF0136 family)